jgi:hypothetical protein
MAVNLSPIGNGITFFGTTGLPLNGGQVYTYQAGSSTPLTTYADNSGLIPNTNPIILGTDGKIPSELWLTAGYNYKFVVEDSASTVVKTYDNIYGIPSSSGSGSSSIPSGCIIVWSGAVGSVPAGYYLCNGLNGTPDLRNSFVLGAGSTYSVGQTGGSTDAVIVSHTHTATVTDPGHAHNYTTTTASSSTANTFNVSQQGTTINTGTTTTASTGISVANSTTGVSGTNANMPPYYSLCYIMKA